MTGIVGQAGCGRGHLRRPPRDARPRHPWCIPLPPLALLIRLRRLGAGPSLGRPARPCRLSLSDVDYPSAMRVCWRHAVGPRQVGPRLMSGCVSVLAPDRDAVAGALPAGRARPCARAGRGVVVAVRARGRSVRRCRVRRATPPRGASRRESDAGMRTKPVGRPAATAPRRASLGAGARGAGRMVWGAYGTAREKEGPGTRRSSFGCEARLHSPCGPAPPPFRRSARAGMCVTRAGAGRAGRGAGGRVRGVQGWRCRRARGSWWPRTSAYRQKSPGPTPARCPARPCLSRNPPDSPASPSPRGQFALLPCGAGGPSRAPCLRPAARPCLPFASGLPVHSLRLRLALPGPARGPVRAAHPAHAAVPRPRAPRASRSPPPVAQRGKWGSLPELPSGSAREPWLATCAAQRGEQRGAQGGGGRMAEAGSAREQAAHVQPQHA
jgi:hypothetical protein